MEVEFMTADTTLPPCMPLPRAMLRLPISSTAKVMYARMLDIVFLSGIEDANGILFIHFPIAELAAALARSTMTVKRSLNELEDAGLMLRVRQGFGEPNKIKGKYQFFVCTHIDKGHIHNHIYYNSTAQDCSRKFHNFIGSSFAVRRLSDRVCIEHELSVIQNPKQHSKGRFLHYGQWIGKKPPTAQQRVRLAIVEALGKKPADFPAFLRLMEESGFAVKHGRGGVISFLAPGQDKYTRLRASVLGPGFDPDDIRAVIAGERPLPELPKDSPAPPRRAHLIIAIQERLAQGKGPA